MSEKKSIWRRLVRWFLLLSIAGVLIVASGLVFIYFKLAPKLPSIESLNHVQFQVPLRVYTYDGKLISEFGEKRREPVKIERVPERLKQAFLAAEDDRFYEHPGVDYQGILRAVIHLIRTGQRGQGGSTITMQLARNFFLSNEKTYERKLNEILLALRIESELSKDKILELYLNKIYLGNRAYGVGAASRVYYGKDVMDLTLAEASMIAGLPKAPSRYNPVINPQRALIRRDYVLRRMRELGYISEQEYAETVALPVTARLHYAKPDVEAGYVAEMVRARMQSIYGDRVYTSGLSVYTTLKSTNQLAATAALRSGLVDYEKRHGFIGPIGSIDLSGLQTGAETAAETIPVEELSDAEQGSGTEQAQADEDGDAKQQKPAMEVVLEALDDYAEYGGQHASVVLQVEKEKAHVLLADGQNAVVSLSDSLWARQRLGPDKLGAEITSLEELLKPGDVVYTELPAQQEAEVAEAETVEEVEEKLAEQVQQSRQQPIEVKLSQLPTVEGALVSIQPQTGRILALVGGFDFHRSKFNRVTQARRQPGSNFKPFIYSAALENGDTAATIYNDAPVVFHDSALEGEWRPENYSGRFYGPTRLREALVKSRNLVSIRVLKGLGLRRALDYVERFGFDIKSLPADLSLALGSGAVTPLKLVSAYSVFANQGYLVPPHYIWRIEDAFGQEIFSSPTVVLCDESCEEQQAAVAASQIDGEDNKQGVNIGTVDETDTAPPALVENEQPTIDEGEESLIFDNIDGGIQYVPRVIDERNAFIMTSILKEVITRGTGRKALELKRNDLAGKTGTTNDQHDAWFSGFNSQVATSVWVGFDELQPLGARETGGQAALPAWIDYMKTALQDIPQDKVTQPEKLVTVRIDKKTGELSRGRGSDNMFEMFRVEYAPVTFLDASSDSAPVKKNTVRQPSARVQERALKEPLF
ncbi:unnamed protein product [Cyprideis torosa]|uniref:Penicillin-binding protein 1A n=1 Tax=Cyprideis torosa TaxID=163714 RepID=A0A7R8W1J3_9CRUS|nr:unnamed protein product [Cyprideis torosa]CAG0878783.1 unnamed protein product [Cyprideis torosa]